MVVVLVAVAVAVVAAAGARFAAAAVVAIEWVPFEPDSVVDWPIGKWAVLDFVVAAGSWWIVLAVAERKPGVAVDVGTEMGAR